MLESNLENIKNIGHGDSLSIVPEFAKNLEDRANVMETHGWIKEAAATRKWALELRTCLINQNYSPEL